MDEVSAVWSIIGTIVIAVIASLATAITARWTNRNERTRLRQEMVEITGRNEQRLSDELDRVRNRANQVDDELEGVRDERRALADEFAAYKIATRETLAERDSSHRQALAEREQLHRSAIAEKDAAHRELSLTLRQVQDQLDECGRELATVRAELERRGEMIRAQGQIIADFQARTMRPPQPGN